MPAGKICVLATANNNLAELARTTLEGHGIAAEVLSYDAGGMAPHLALYSGGSRVMVNAQDLSAAEELLKDFREIKPCDPDIAKTRGFLTRLRYWLIGKK